MSWVILLGAAFVAGVVNALAGGGTLLTFPSLQSFGGLTGLTANGTSTLSLMPASLASGWGYRAEMAGPMRAWLWLLLPVSLVGGVVGALLAVRLPPETFAAAVPWLLLTATLLFLIQPALTPLVKGGEAGAVPTGWALAGVMVFQLGVAVYGGYFGAGIGILMLAALGVMGVGDIHQMNAVKSLLAVAINGVSVVVFIIAGQVHWGMALAMMASAVVGGYVGAKYGKALPKVVVRWFVIVVGLGMSAWYFVKG